MRIDCSAPRTAMPTAMTNSPNSPSRTSFAPMPLASPEKKSDSKMMVAISAIEAPATTSCPKGVPTWPASFRTGITIPSEVADRVMPTRSGDLTSPLACRPRPISSASPNEIAYPSAVRRSRRPRKRSYSTSRPASRSRKASPSRLMTWIGVSIETQLST
jgi:hypothetical protein